MQIEDDTCYIRHFVDADKEFVSLSHYQEVWDTGFSVDDYIIEYEDIYYEGASYHNIDPDMIDAGTYIMKKLYLRWTKQIQQAKETAVRMMQQSAAPINRNLAVGDYILYTWVDDEEDETYRCENEYNGMRIVEIKDDRLLVQSVLIGEHSFDSRDEIDYREPDDVQNSSGFITAEAFNTTHDYMRNFCRQLLEEIKSQVKTTEQIYRT